MVKEQRDATHATRRSQERLDDFEAAKRKSDEAYRAKVAAHRQSLDDERAARRTSAALESIEG